MAQAKTAATDPVAAGFKVIATKETPSLSGSSNVTYMLGRDDDGTLYIRLHEATGGGFFNSEWFRAEDLADILRQQSKTEPFTSMVLAPLFAHRSENSRGFMAAALRAEGALVPARLNSRLLRVGDIDAFLQQTTPAAPKRRKPAAKASHAKAKSTSPSKTKASSAD